MKKRVIAMLALAIGFMAASCKPEKVLRPTSVSVSPSSVSLVEGETTILSVSVQPSEAQFSGISWSSSDTKVATVSNGTVTAVSAGKATISASADGIIGTATVTVTAKIIAVTGVSLDKSELELTEGDEAQLKATVAPDDATDKSITWKSSDDKVATVSSEGKVTAVKAGTATITVTTEDGGKTATCAVTVKSGLPEGALSGVFSVSATKKVYFSKGNLVATIDATGAPTAWKFAAHQYDCLGEGGANKTIGATAGDVDLFGWSTSTNGGTSTTDNYGIKKSTKASDYSGDFYDWGKAVGDGNTWRTLTTAEWQYLFNNHIKKWVTVNSVNGYVIAPDDFTGTLQESYANDAELVTAGNLVFLPAAGARGGSDVDFVGGYGFFWSSTAYDEDGAYGVYFRSSSVDPGKYVTHNLGCSVRLITDVK